MPRIAIPIILALSVAGCSTAEPAPAKQQANPGDSSKTLCKRFSEYVVKRADLNKSVSPCNLYFYADDALHGSSGKEKYFRVIIRRGSPIQLSEVGDNRGEPVAPNDQLRPHYYKWTILDDKGKIIRSWLAYFLKNRDGNYHTVVSLPPDEWDRSVLEVYFQDVDDDRELRDVNVTFKLMVGDILGTGK